MSILLIIIITPNAAGSARNFKAASTSISRIDMPALFQIVKLMLQFIYCKNFNSKLTNDLPQTPVLVTSLPPTEAARRQIAPAEICRR